MILAALAMLSQPANIQIDTKKTMEPVSKYIYGQFIEHLGRCIYGGIWAEMIQDRKFYFPVGSKDSPWKLLGGTARMDADDAFSGEHSAVVSRGIVQGGLTLAAGWKYVGSIWLSGNSRIRVSLVWDGGRANVDVHSIRASWQRFDLRYSIVSENRRTLTARLEIKGDAAFRIGAISLMPADNVHGMRRDTLALLKQLDSPIYRWPGGIFVSGYDWRDGIGDRDRRPTRKNPAWRGIDGNDFGLNEFIEFCREVKTEPYVVVNSGFGDAHSAAEEVAYAKKHGFHVKWWGIGNEMYGDWQLGHMSLAQYTRKHNEFARAMRRADPSIKLIAVGDAGPWSEGMLRDCADSMDLISEHFYRSDVSDAAAFVAQMPAAIKAKTDAHRGYRQRLASLKGRDIRIALDEWNYWHGPEIYGEIGVRFFMRDGLGIAAGLNELVRQSDLIFMANYAQTVNVIGCIKTTATDAQFEVPGLVLKLYRERFGTIPVAMNESPKPLDVVAALTADRKFLTVAIVNPTPEKRTLEFTGAKAGRAGAYVIADDDPMAYNEPGKQARVSIREAEVPAWPRVDVRPYSVTLILAPNGKPHRLSGGVRCFKARIR